MKRTRPAKAVRPLCHVCGKVVKRHAFEIFLEAEGMLLRFHTPCLAEWVGVDSTTVAEMKAVFDGA